MKALSIRQPWAWAILHAGKNIENRDWPTRFCGPVLIHASKGMTRHEYESFCDTFRATRRADPDAVGYVEVPAFDELQRGGIVGQAEIVDCVEESDSPWFFGKFGFVLRNASPVPFRPMNGALGLFDVPSVPAEAAS